MSEEGVEDSPIDKKRKLLIKQYEQDKDLFWDKLKLSITKSFNKNIEGKGSINVAGVQRWMSNQVLLIRASNEDGKGNYNQLPGIGEKLLPFVYPILLELITMTKEVDTDLYDSLMLQLNKGFDEMLNKDDTSPLDNIKFDAEASTNALQTLFGGYAEGSPEGFYHEGLAFRTYMNKYFLGDLKLFLKYELSPENFTDLISEPYYENISYFFQLIQVQAKLQQIYDNAKSKGKINANLKNLAKMAELEK